MPAKKQKIKFDKRKQTFMTRTKSGVFVFLFYITYALLLIFSNQNWFPVLCTLDVSDMNKVQFSLNFINVLMIIPIIYFAAKEITNLCFPGKKGIFIYTICAIFTLTMGISIYLLGTKYGFFPIQIGDPTSSINETLNAFTIFLLISISGIILFTIASTLVWVFMSRHVVYVGKKTRIWYPTLVFILNTFFIAFIYTTILHTWTTFLFLIILSTCSDVFAYICGSWFGKHKLVPNISPNKTWEGIIFGFLITLAIYCGIIGLFYIPGAEAQGQSLYCFLGNQSCGIDINNSSTWFNLQPYYWSIYIPVGLLLMVVSFFGDLFFSFIKRHFHIKDFSNLIPGHGGILDRIDSMIFIFTFYFLTTIIIQLIFALAVPGVQTGLYYLWTGATTI